MRVLVKCIVAIIVFYALSSCVRQQGPIDDSARNHIDSLLGNVNRLLIGSDYDSARIVLRSIDSLSELYRYAPAKYDVYANQAWIFEQEYSYDSAISYYELSTSQPEFLRDSNTLADRIARVGRIYRLLGRFDKSVEAYERAYWIAEEIKDEKMVASLSNRLGILFSDLEEHENAIHYFRISLLIRESKKDFNYARTLHNFATTLVDLDSIEDALPYLYEALEIKDSLRNENSMAYTYSGLGTAYRKLGNLVLSKEMFLKAYDIRRRLNDKQGLGQVLFRLGNLELLNSNFVKAEENLDKAESYALELGHPELLREILESKKDLYKATDRLREWVATDQVFDVLTDSLQREQRLRVQEAQSKAELQREQQRTALAEQGAQIARLEVESERQKGELRLVLIFVALLALLIIGWQLWQLRKRNSVLIALNNRIKLITDNAFHSQKNALGLISAILRSKARQSEHDKELEVLKDVEGKIEALGGVAKYLFQTRIADNTAVAARIQLASYLESLINDTFASVAGDKAHLKLDLEDIAVNSTEALNIGLIANEAITNFSKYAATSGADKLQIETRKEDGELLVQIRDNGPGFPEGFKISKGSGFGMQMIANLVEDMEGVLSTLRKEGWTLIRISIPLNA